MSTQIKLTKYEIVELYRTLSNNLDGRPEPAFDGDGKSLGLVVKPYDFDNDALYGLAKTLRLITGPCKDIETAQRKIAAKYDKTKPDEIEKANNEIRDFLETQELVSVHLIAKADLKHKTNKLPTPVLSNLLLIVKEEQPPGEEGKSEPVEE